MGSKPIRVTEATVRKRKAFRSDEAMIAQHDITVLHPDQLANESTGLAVIPAQERATSIAIYERQATLERIEKLATLLAHSAFVPKHLVVAGDAQRTVATCFRVVAQADRWGVDPFALADETYTVGGKLGYQGKLIAAVVNSRANLDGRLSYTFSGRGEDLTVEVSGKFKNEDTIRTVTARLGDVKTTNQMWTKDPEQKLCYTGAIKWARRHCPEVVTGVLTAEDLEVMSEQTPPPPPPTAEEIEQKKRDAAAKQAEAMRLAGMGGGAVAGATSNGAPLPASPQATEPAATTATPAKATKAAKSNGKATTSTATAPVDPPSPSEIAAAPISAAHKARVKELMTTGGLGELIDADEFNAYLHDHYKANTLSNLTDMQAQSLIGWLLAEKEKRTVAKEEATKEAASEEAVERAAIQDESSNPSSADNPTFDPAEACGEVVNGETVQSNSDKSEGQPVVAEVSTTPQAEASEASVLKTDKSSATQQQIATIRALIKQKAWHLNAPKADPDYQSQTVYLASKNCQTFGELSEATAAKLIANLNKWDDAPAKN